MNDGRFRATLIAGFHQDGEGHWVAELACGHAQHMRHRPPWQNRPWVQTPAGRAAKVGTSIECTRCGPADADRAAVLGRRDPG